MKQLLLSISLSLVVVSVGFSQATAANQADPVKVVRAGNKTTFGTGQQAVADYLVSKNISTGEGITYKRAAFKLLIDYQGKVVEASRFYGGISSQIDADIIAAFSTMPKWNTSISENEQSMVYVVVTLQNQVLTTELY
ncbi:MAG TPA: hypothetical protein VK151_01535 [Fluviicola sp.]|nr:hypothetical protein [Fluviicola sp.]